MIPVPHRKKPPAHRVALNREWKEGQYGSDSGLPAPSEIFLKSPSKTPRTQPTVVALAQLSSPCKYIRLGLQLPVITAQGEKK